MNLSAKNHISCPPSYSWLVDRQTKRRCCSVKIYWRSWQRLSLCVCVSVFYGLRDICLLSAHSGDSDCECLLCLFSMAYTMVLCLPLKDVHIVPASLLLSPLSPNEIAALEFKCRSLSVLLSCRSLCTDSLKHFWRQIAHSCSYTDTTIQSH